MTKKSDVYQNRYLAHQERKQKQIKTRPETGTTNLTFEEVIETRRSRRRFKKNNADLIKRVLRLAENRPSSCNRKGVYIKMVTAKEVGDLLVGGVGWIPKANKVLLFFADMKAYKSPNEVIFMPYLDAGVYAMYVSLIAEYNGVANCIVNPNIRAEDQFKFNKKFNKKGHKLCCALVC